MSDAETQERSAEPSKPEYSEEELLSIFDTIMFEGVYQEDVMIRGKLKVTFRSLSVKDSKEITNTLDSKQFNLASTFQEQRAIMNLARSLVFYNSKDLSSMTIIQRTEFVESLPSAIVAAISNALVVFSKKVFRACEAGQENF